MNIAVVGKNKDEVDRLKKSLKSFGYVISSKNPEGVISFGGDGTFLV